MKLEVLQENFAKAINLACRFVSLRVQLPVLTNILLETGKNKLSVAATNLETSVNISVGARVSEEGCLTVPSRIINDLVSNLEPGSLTLKTEKEQLEVLIKDFSSLISGMNSKDFPDIPRKIDEKRLSLPRQEFNRALAKVLFAVSVDETRPILTGVLLVIKKNNLSLVSTDGFRLSQVKMSLALSEKVGKINIPRSILGEILRLPFEDEKILLSLKSEENQIVFKVADVVLSSRLLQGDFPDFEKIMPKEAKTKVRVDKEDFYRAIKLASVFARDSANIVKLTVGKNDLEVFAESQYSGSQKTQIEAQIEGEEMEIAFNFRFLEDFLQAVEDDEIQMDFSGPGAPGVFTDPKDSGFLHLIMPVKIQE